MKEYSEIFPLQSIEEGCLVSPEGDITKVFEWQLPEVFSFGKDGYYETYKSLYQICKGLPNWTRVHQCNFVYAEAFKGNKNYVSNYCTIKDIEHWSARPVYKQKTYLALTLPVQEGNFKRVRSGNPFLSVKKFAIEKPFKDFEKRIASFNEVFNSFQNAVDKVKGHSIRQLDDEELQKLLYQYITFTFDQDNVDPDHPIDPIYPSDNYFTIGNKHYKILTLNEETHELPTSEAVDVSAGAASGYDMGNASQRNLHTSYSFPIVQGLPVKHITNFCFEIVPTQELTSYLNTVKLSINPLVPTGNKDVIYKLKSIDEFTSSLAANNGKAVKFNMDVILADEDLNRLNNHVGIVKNTFNKLNGSSGWIENNEALALWNSSIFGARRDMFRWKISNITNSLLYFVKESYPSGHNEGFYYLDSFGNPIAVNFANNPDTTNRHKVIIGRSGSGKTFWSLGYLERCHALGYKIMVIDIKHDYRRLCNNLGGKYYDSEDLTTMSKNVFECRTLQTDKYEPSRDFLNTLYAIIKIIWKGNDPISKTEETILNDLCQLYYVYLNKHKKTACVDSFYEYIDVYYSEELPEVRKRYLDPETLKLTLSPFLKGGQNEFVFNEPENSKMDVDNSFTVFSLKAIVDDPVLFPVYALMITQMNADMMKKLDVSVRKLFAIDEAWKAFRGDLREVAEYNYRVARSLNGEICVMTQYITDIEESGIAGAIKGNAETKILFMQKEDEFDQIKKTIGLNSHDLDLLRNVKKYEFFIKFGDHVSMILTSKFSPNTVAMYETNAEKVGKIDGLIKEYGGNVEAAINEYVLPKDK